MFEKIFIINIYKYKNKLNINTEIFKNLSQYYCLKYFCVCCSHFSVPFMPPIPGLDKFSGCVDHSHYYRVPDSYTNKTVVVLGASASGRDISLELSTVAKKVGWILILKFFRANILITQQIFKLLI